MSRISTFVTGLAQRQFLRQVVILMTGTGMAQALTIVAAPFLSRLYEPSAFGLFSLYTSIVSVLAGVSAWRYEVAIVLPDEEEEAGSLLIIAMLAVITMATVVFLVALGFGISGMVPFPQGEILHVIGWISLSVLAVGIYQTLTYWCTRRQAFARLSASQVFRSAGVTATQVTGGVLHTGAFGLIGGQILGQVLVSFVLGTQVWREDRHLFRRSLSMPAIRKAAKQYARFPMYSAPQTLLNAISQNIPSFLLMKSYGATVVGWYALAVRLIEMPLGIIGQSLSQVYYQRASQGQRRGESLYALWKRATLGLVLIGSVPALAVISFGPWLFSVVLGDSWDAAGEYARWIVVWLFFGFINSPSIATAQVYGLQRFLLGYEICLFVARTLALLLGVAHLDALGSIAIYCLTGAAFNLLLIVAIMLYGRRKQIETKVVSTMSSQPVD
ncbi:lipopolysaccharide biosynthesis protein [Brevibacillus sp. NRS-1366]|uniref:lipopolysaccharide biosynthesis protein n=1 Tax=Brevibacillus sp. NRS-1366 TaxID=3233899 RepID=UPI003D221861